MCPLRSEELDVGTVALSIFVRTRSRTASREGRTARRAGLLRSVTPRLGGCHATHKGLGLGDRREQRRARHARLHAKKGSRLRGAVPPGCDG